MPRIPSESKWRAMVGGWLSPLPCSLLSLPSFLFKDFFFNVDHLKNLYLIFFNNMLPLFMFCFFDPEACGILAPLPGIELTSPR